jgi:ankyrin repeat protein
LKETAWTLAVYHNQVDVVKYFVSKKADVNLVYDGEFSRVSEDKKRAEYLIPLNGCTPLMIAALLGHTKIVKVMIAAKANPDCLNGVKKA